MRGNWIIPASVVVAWVLALLPMPDWAAPYRPEWAVLVMAYWVMALPARVNIGWCWLVGLTLDILKGTLLGQHALALALAGWIVARFHLQVRVFPPWQQALVILALVGVYEFTLFWTDGFAGNPQASRWGPVLTTAILWPWVFGVLRIARRRTGAA